MTLTTKLLAAAGLVGTGILVERVRRALARGVGDTYSGMGAPQIFDAELVAGISEVDPEPLAQTSGEGIDIDANEAAHRRTLLPRKNAP